LRCSYSTTYRPVTRYTRPLDGWELRTREGGLVYFKGRRSEMIKTKGANVAPAEVESVLDALPHVRVSFVVGIPHESHGEEVAAAVIPEQGQEIDVDDLLAHARRELSSIRCLPASGCSPRAR
jgi:acyl-CoA synthetase (AMP-forming)/AMP-acid ligase II